MEDIQNTKTQNYRRRVTYEKLQTIFNELNYNLILSEDEFNSTGSVMRLKLSFICNEHPQLKKQVTNYENIRKGHRQCAKCISEHYSSLKKGSKGTNWRGGKTKLNNYLRNVITDWKYESQKACNFKCIITSEEDQKRLALHHLYSFDTIVNEALDILEFNFNNQIGEYSKEELAKIEDMVIYLHNKYPLGVVILDEWHKHFHSIYDNKNNTPEQFYEYLKVYHGIKFKAINSSNKETTRYFPFKDENIRESKYHGVIKNKTGKRFTATIGQFGKSMYIGTYDTDYEAAYFYNQEAIKYRGKNATLNYLTDEQLDVVKSNLRKGKYEEVKSSRFINVRYKNGKWETQFRHGGKVYHCGTYDNELLAVYIVDKKKNEIIGENATLNDLTKDEFLEATRLYKEYLNNRNYYKHKENSKTPYSCIFYRNGKWKPYYQVDGKNKYIEGIFETDKEAAIAYNEYVVNNNLDRKLNKII